MPKPIMNYKDFCKALKATVKRGFKYWLHRTAVRIPNQGGEGWVSSYSLWHETKAGSLYPPECVVAQVFFKNNIGSWMPSEFASEAIGLTERQAKMVRLAVHEQPNHLGWLRKRLLESCGLEDIPHNERQVYGEDGNPWLQLPERERSRRRLRKRRMATARSQ